MLGVFSDSLIPFVESSEHLIEAVKLKCSSDSETSMDASAIILAYGGGSSNYATIPSIDTKLLGQSSADCLILW